MTAKLDLKKQLDGYRARRGEFRILEVPPANYLMLDGEGDPNTPVFAEAIEALYPLAYTIKFASKRQFGRDYVVAPLEALWWAADMSAFAERRDKARWKWTLLLMQPEWIDADLVEESRATVESKGAPPRLDDVRFETLDEGRCAQTLHVGPFDDEAPVLARLHDEVIPENGLALAGKHHEIYLSDLRKVAPEKLRTILRQPVASG